MSEQTQDTCVHAPESLTCASVTSQYADVSVPLKLTPYATVGKLVTDCCGEPMVTLHPCQGAGRSCGCELTITQTVCIRITLDYGTTADMGDITAVCKRNPGCTGGSSLGCR